MYSHKSFPNDVFFIFRYQVEHNPVYKSYIKNLGVNPEKVDKIENIPFLPIDFFKRHTIKTGSWEGEVVFESSGTTGQERSRHDVKDPVHYLNNSQRIFESFYGPLAGSHFLALLPSYLERNNSSLVMMADHFIKHSGSSHSGFYLDDYQALLHTLEQTKDGKPVFLMGVSFALLDLAEKHAPDISHVTVIETGGMKGRRKELTRQDLHQTLQKSFGVSHVHSEYGMTELFSQAYAKEGGRFVLPNQMKVLIRDVNDPFDLQPRRKTGGINIIDMANVDTCCFIETQDLGKLNEDGTFEILGRFDNSDVRGCNLLISEY